MWIYYLKGLRRWVLFHLFRHKAEVGFYGDGDSVPGYRGWYRLNGECLVFIRDDSRLQFVW